MVEGIYQNQVSSLMEQIRESRERQDLIAAISLETRWSQVEGLMVLVPM